MGVKILSIICKMDASNWIDIIAIVVNTGLAIWIVGIIQDKLTNKRVLKDHFIDEIKSMRGEYKTLLTTIHNDKMNPKLVLSWFKLMNVKVMDLLESISSKHECIATSVLNPYRFDLREIITNSEEFNSQFKDHNTITFNEQTKNTIINFQSKNSHIFNDLIIKVNDAE